MAIKLSNNDLSPANLNTSPARGPRVSHGILSIALHEKQSLYDAYMPFVKGGGLFIETNRDFHLGEEVFALLQIMDEPDKSAITGKVIWMTPKSPQNRRKQGIGIQISSEDVDLAKKIETYLAGFNVDSPSETL